LEQRWESSDVPGGVVCGCVDECAALLSSLELQKEGAGSGVGWEELYPPPGHHADGGAAQDNETRWTDFPGLCNR